MLSTHPSNFRVRLMLDLFSALAVPSIILKLILRFYLIHLGRCAPVVYVASIFCWAMLKGAYAAPKQHKLAGQLGARPIPSVVGKWPGNLDILLRMTSAFKTSYVLDVYLQLFEEYQCTTLNLRILWADNVSRFLQVRSYGWFSGDCPIFEAVLHGPDISGPVFPGNRSSHQCIACLRSFALSYLSEDGPHLMSCSSALFTNIGIDDGT